MKRTLLSMAFLVSFMAQGQEEEAYNHWSLDVGIGINNAREDFAPGYRMEKPGFPTGNLGVRYMFNKNFGTRFGLGYQALNNDPDKSAYFETDYFSASLEGVANLGQIMDFSTWTEYFSILGHAGFGYSRMHFDAAAVPKDTDEMMHWVFGITPQIKLSNRVSLNLDASMIGHFFQKSSYDGTRHAPNGDTYGMGSGILKGSIGFSIYLGEKDSSADFPPQMPVQNSRLDSIEQRLTKIESDMRDTDDDGVADYLDQEPDSESGAVVNTKGVSVDDNGNGIPDSLEVWLEQPETTKSENYQRKVVEELFDGGYVNVYFNFDSTEPTEYSMGAMDLVLTYFRGNPDAQAELVGYTDALGNEIYNRNLSERRAKKVRDILVAAGIAPERLSARGGGIDDSVQETSPQARQLVRKVTIRLKE